MSKSSDKKLIYICEWAMDTHIEKAILKCVVPIPFKIEHCGVF